MSDSSNAKKRTIVVAIHKYPLGQQPREIESWRNQSIEARLAAPEAIRREYHGWTDETRPRLERVYRIVKRK